jgi:hypothetical protein
MKSILIFTFFINITQQTIAQICFPPFNETDTLVHKVMEFQNKIREAFDHDQYILCVNFYDSLAKMLGNEIPPGLSTLKMVLVSFQTLLTNATDSVKDIYTRKFDLLYESGALFYGHKIMESGWAKDELLSKEFDVYTIVDSPPLPKEGIKEFGNYLLKNMVYPKAALENSIEGLVFVMFIVDKEGYLSGLRPIRGIGYGCDEEAVRLIEESAPWEPGKLVDGKPVYIRYILPIKFNLKTYLKNQLKN